MLANFTWYEYLMAIGLALATYYSYVLLQYYVPGYRKQKSVRVGKQQNLGQDFEGPAFGNDEVSEAVLDQVDTLIHSVSGIAEEGAEKNQPKDYLLEQVSDQLSKYPGLRDSEYRAGINLMIVEEFEKKLSLTLDERDVDGLWNS